MWTRSPYRSNRRAGIEQTRRIDPRTHASSSSDRRLDIRITERGGQPREPLWYKHEYLRRLEERIASRVAGVRGGTIPYDDLLVHGTRALLADLRRRGLAISKKGFPSARRAFLRPQAVPV